MIEIYTDASFNEVYKENPIDGGIGIVAVRKSDDGRVVETFNISRRYTKKEIVSLLDFPCIAITNNFFEFFAAIEALCIFMPYQEDIRLYTDSFLAYTAFNDDEVFKRKILKRLPNEKFLYHNFVECFTDYKGTLSVRRVKGHGVCLNNRIADYLAMYWIDTDIVLERAKSCVSMEMMSIIKKLTMLERSWKGKGKELPFEKFLEKEINDLKQGINGN